MTKPLPAVFAGLHVGKSDHHDVALTAAGRTVLDKPLPNLEAKLRTILGSLAERGLVLIVVDQSATIVRFRSGSPRPCPGKVACLSGLAMRRIADLRPGTATRDASIIADAACTMPHTLRPIRADKEQIAAPVLLAGFDDDLSPKTTAVSNPRRARPTRRERTP